MWIPKVWIVEQFIEKNTICTRRGVTIHGRVSELRRKVPGRDHCQLKNNIEYEFILGYNL
jgi:hypothetical protein